MAPIASSSLTRDTENRMLKMTHLSKVYRTEVVETYALRDFSIHVKEGEFVAVTGPSGSGKTTFLTIAGLLEEFTGGQYHLDCADVHGLNDNQRSRLRNQKIGFIFQSFNLIPDLNVFDNVDVPLRYRRLPGAERRKRINEALERVGLSARSQHHPGGAVGRSAAACRHCPRPGRGPETVAGGRTDGKPGYPDGPWRHAAS